MQTPSTRSRVCDAFSRVLRRSFTRLLTFTTAATGSGLTEYATVMVKKRNAAVEPTAATPVQTRESLQRISYLMQASVLLRSLISPELGAEQQQTPTDRHDDPAAATSAQLAAIQGARDDAPLASANTAQGATRRAAQPRPGKEGRRKRPRRASTQALEPVSDHLASQMSSVAKKATVRM